MFAQEAERMLGIQAPLGGKRVDDVISTVFPKDKDETERQKKNREEVNELVRAIYQNERNGAKYGFNGWSLYNAIVEYLDFYRSVDSISSAIASMDDTSSITQKKLLAHRLVVS
jgi:hypothetical protein